MMRTATPSRRAQVLPRRVVAVICATVASWTAHHAHGAASDLTQDAARVERAWIAASARVVRMRPQFLIGGQVQPVLIPPVEDVAPGCLSVGVLGTRDTEFGLDLQPRRPGLDKTPHPTRQTSTQSVAGAAMLVRCGKARADLADLVIRMRSPQGALEVLVANGESEAPPLEQLLPERAPGPLAPNPQPSPPPLVASFTDRVAIARRQLVEAGGQQLPDVEARADGVGNGTLPIRLEQGCHRLYAIADARQGDAVLPVDLDMEVVHLDGAEPVAQDRGFGSDATVEVCVGVPEDLQVRFAGAVPGQRVTLLHGKWDIPNAIPETWSPRARAATTHALLHRRVGQLLDAPVWEGIGVSGTTVIPVAVTPGGCYVFAAGLMAGDARAIRVTLQAGPRRARDGGGGGFEAGLVAVCAGPHETLRVEVDAIGPRIVWVAGLWHVGKIPLGTEGMR
ncbi:MAG: hypothetical protein MUF54_14535 [Polyangiaceae bacterium]|jgi:hypothetical protein|nr:hypothetical protein [Polyangiaceae bacterium]